MSNSTQYKLFIGDDKKNAFWSDLLLKKWHFKEFYFQPRFHVGFFYGMHSTQHQKRILAGSISKNKGLRDGSNLAKFHAFNIKVNNFGR